MLIETDPQNAFCAHGEIAREGTRLIVEGIAGLHMDSHLMLASANLDSLRFWVISTKNSEFLFGNALERSLEDCLIIHPDCHIRLRKLLLYLDVDCCKMSW